MRHTRRCHSCHVHSPPVENDIAGTVEEGAAALTVAEGFMEVVDVFCDLIDEDRYVSILLRCADIARISDGAILLCDANGRLGVSVASAPAVAAVLGPEALSAHPSFAGCVESGLPVTGELSPSDAPFDPFVLGAINMGFRHEYVFPVAYRGATLGAVVLLDPSEERIDPWRVDVTGTIARATGAMVHMARTNALLGRLVAELQTALDSRVVIEQAKGVLAGRNGQDLDSAFRLIRQKARSERRPVIDVAREFLPRG